MKLSEVLGIYNPKDFEGDFLSGRLFAIVNPHLVRRHPELFIWKDEPAVMGAIEDACVGPFPYVVLFLEK